MSIHASRMIYRIAEVSVGPISVLASALIVLGAAVMTWNIALLMAIPKTLSQISGAESRKLRRAFGFLRAMMAFFLCGHLITVYGIMKDSPWRGDLVAGIVFFLGAILVLQIVWVQTKMLASIRENHRGMIAARQRSGETNEPLQSEMFVSKRQEEGLKDTHGTLEQRVLERIEAVESLRRERDLAQKYLDIAGVMLVALDNEGRVDMINKRGCKILGGNEAEILGTSWFERFIPSEAREKVWLTFKELLAGRVEPVEYFENCIVTRTGEKRDMAWYNTILRNDRGEIIGTLSSGEDITERKRAETELRESEEKYRTLVESSSDAILMLDKERKIVSCNRAFLDLFGYTHTEVLGRSVRMIHPSDSSFRAFGQAAYPVIESRNSFRAEWGFARKDGRIIPAETVTSVIKGPGGSIRGYVAIIRDITEKQQIQTQLHEAQKMEAIGTLAGGIAHDFNNLLMTIQGNASLVLLEADPGHRHYEYLKNILTQVRSGARLTAQLLGYARKGKYEVRPMDFNALVKDVSDAFGRTRKEVTIQRKLAVDLPAIEADEGQMEQLLLNFFVNAADAMPSGGHLTLETSHVGHKQMRGRLYDPKPGGYVSLAITDTGVGMDKQTQERIFEPFFTTKEMGRGTGLGLASVYGIAKSHGGHIEVESEKGRGTTFTVFLPVSKQTPPVRVEVPGQALGGSETVLIVDDEELVLEVGAGMLERLGYNVHKANSGREAIDLYKENSTAIDLVILDMIMPQLGGGQVYDRLKETNPHVKVLLSSGYSVEGQASDILKRGCDGFIQKPFTIEELSQKVREILAEKKPIFP